MAKPQGWWTTHPSILNVSVAGAWDSNGDGIGDFEGIRRHLDWLVGSGISGIRFQQVTRFDDDFEWHGLVAQDWFDVDPVYGTLADFDRLMADCRARDFRILLMAVPEYVGWRHPAYRASKEARAEGITDPHEGWFVWEDDGTVRTVWNHPGPDTAHPGYLDAYLEHLMFWMDRGISGYDADAVHDWMNLSVATERRICEAVKTRGGLITAECFVLSDDILRQGGWNAGTGQWRTRLYNELDAIMEGEAAHIRTGLAMRRELIDLGMFPYQQFGDEMLSRYTGKNLCHKLPMWRLQVAFNAALPDQVWVLANAITCPTREMSRTLPGLRASSWAQLDVEEIKHQEGDADSPLQFFKRLFVLRAREKALGIGEMDELPSDHRREVFCALRTSQDGTERAVTAFNFTSGPLAVTVQLGGRDVREVRNYLSGERMRPDPDGSLTLALGPYGFKLLRVAPPL